MEGGSTATLLGTDFQGRDILSRLIYGARVSLIVGVMGTLVAGGIGTALGILAGYLGGWVDQVIMRVTDAWLALPALVFAIFLADLVGPSMWNIIIILGAVYWTRYARVIRGEVLSLREREFVKLAEIAGASQAARDPAPHPAERHEHGDGAGQPHHRRRDHRRGVAELSRRRRAAAAAGLGLMLAEARSTLMAGQWWLTVFPGAVHHAGRAGDAAASATGCASASIPSCATSSVMRARA